MTKKILRVARWLALHSLPEPLLYRLWHTYLTHRPRSALATAEDVHRIEIQDSVVLDVFWVDATLGPGPGASLYVLGEEVLRLDCFGAHGLTGHYHINPGQAELSIGPPARLYFPAGDYADHIQRAATEIELNLPAMLAMNRNQRIRNIDISPERREFAAAELRATMFELIKAHGR